MLRAMKKNIPTVPGYFVLPLWLLLGGLWLPLNSAAQGLAGQEFWVAFLNNDSPTVQLQLSIATGAQPAMVQVEMPANAGFAPQTLSIPANSQRILTLDAAQVLSSNSEIVENLGILVSASAPITVFAGNTSGNSGDQAAVLPLEALGQTAEYYLVSHTGTGAGVSEAVIVALEDASEVIITPKTITSSGRAVNDTLRLTLNRGQALRLQGNGSNDLSGSIVESCKPLAVFSGVGTTSVPAACLQRSHLFAQMLPAPLWGNRYFAPPLPAADAEYTLKFVAAEDNTVFLVDSTETFSLNRGQAAERRYRKGVCVSSSVPASVTLLLQSNDCNLSGDGAPAMQPLNHALTGTRNAFFAALPQNSLTERFVTLVFDRRGVNLPPPIVLLNGQVINPNLTAFAPSNDYAFARISLALSDTAFVLEANANFHAYLSGTGPSDGFLTLGGTSFSTQQAGISVGQACPQISTTLAGRGRNIVRWDWDFGDGTRLTQNTAPQSLVNVNKTYAAGSYTIRLIQTNSAGCVDTVSTEVVVANPATQIQSPVSLCNNQPAVIDAGEFDSYRWSTGETTRSITVGQPGNYSVTVTIGACSSTTPFVVQFGQRPEARIESTPSIPSLTRQNQRIAYICPERNEVFTFSPAPVQGLSVSALWIRPDSSTLNGSQLAVREPGLYQLVLTGNNGCTDTTQIQLVALCETDLQVPTAFTPNGDGLNDVLEFFGEGISDLRLSIVNRWGETVFSTNDLNQTWDGTYLGQNAQAGLYTWKATYKSAFFPGQTLQKFGKVTLIR